MGWIGWGGPFRRVRRIGARGHVASFALYATPVLVILFVFAARSASPPQRVDDLTMDFVDQPYLHHNPDGADLGAARLLRYDLSADSLAPGDTLTVTLYWDGPTDTLPVSVRLVSPAGHISDLHSGPLELAENQAPLAETTVHRLTLPENTPRGLYLIQLQLAGSEQAPLFLRPVRVTGPRSIVGGGDAPVLALVGPDIRLHAATLQGKDSYLVAQMEWSAVRQITANYQVSVRGESGWQPARQPRHPARLWLCAHQPVAAWRTGRRPLQPGAAGNLAARRTATG